MKFSPEVLREIHKIRTAAERRIADGGMPEEVYADELRTWSALHSTKYLFPPYYRLQICCVFRMQYEGCRVTENSAVREILDEWKAGIMRDGLRANVEIPDDEKMLKLLSRRTRFTMKAWEQGGHRHRTDGFTLPERIYMIHAYLEDKT